MASSEYRPRSEADGTGTAAFNLLPPESSPSSPTTPVGPSFRPNLSRRRRSRMAQAPRESGNQRFKRRRKRGADSDFDPTRRGVAAARPPLMGTGGLNPQRATRAGLSEPHTRRSIVESWMAGGKRYVHRDLRGEDLGGAELVFFFLQLISCTCQSSVWSKRRLPFPSTPRPFLRHPSDLPGAIKA